MIETLRKYWYWWLAPVIITYIFLYPVKKNGFVDFDDALYVTKNKVIEKENKSFNDFFSPEAIVAGNYHPLTMLSLAIDYSIAGKKPAQYHSTNLLFHIVNTFLVFLFVYFVLYKNPLTAGFVSLVFGLHPMHVESVAWISERKDVLYLFFFLLSILVFYKYRKKENTWLYVFSLFLFICSLLSKGMAVTLPVILILIDWYKGEKLSGKNLLKKIPFFILSIGSGIFSFYIQHNTRAIADDHLGNFMQLVSNSCYSVMIYLVKFLFPLHLSAYIVYPELYNNSHIYPASMYWAPVIFLGLLIAVYSVRKNRALIFGLAFFYISVFLVSQIIPVGSTIVSERYTYLAYIGLAFPIGAWLAELPNKQNLLAKYKTVVYIITIGWLMWLSFSTFKRTEVWKNSNTLWADAIKKLEKPAVYPYHAHASYLAYRSEIDVDKPDQIISREDYLKAIREMKIVISMDPKELYIADLAYYYGFAEQHNLCLLTFNRVIKMNPTNKSYYLNKAISQWHLKDFNGEYETYCDALKYFPKDSTVLRERIQLGINLNKTDSVIKDANQLLAIPTQLASGYLYRGIGYYNKGEYEEALADLLLSSKINSSNAITLFHTSMVYFKIGDKVKAKKYLQMAVSKGYQLEPAYLKLLE